MRSLVLTALAVASFGCGQTSGSDAGPDVQGFDQITTGCVNGSSQSYPVDAGVCMPQLESSYSCNGSACSWTVTIPCNAPNDAGADGGDAGDDGGIDCQSVCDTTAPPGPHTSITGFCQPSQNDAGTHVICGGCGV